MIEANVDRPVALLHDNFFVMKNKPEIIGVVYSIETGKVHRINKNSKQLAF